MRPWKLSKPDLFKKPYELPSPQRTIAVELLKALLIEAMSTTKIATAPSAVAAGNNGADHGEATDDEQDHA
jgi:hypothetical protein